MTNGAENYQRTEVKIPDEVGLVIQLLMDDYRNHLLKHVVPYNNIVTKFPETWDELPCIYVKKSGVVNMLQEEAIPGGVGSTWEAQIEIHLITSDDSYCNYPPHEAGEVDEEATRYEGAEKVLNVMFWLIYRTLSENKVGYQDADDSTFQWDFITPVGFEYIDGGYEGIRDMWAIIITYQFKFEILEIENG